MKSFNEVPAQDKMLLANLQAYLQRYPWDFERLSKIATREIPMYFDLPTYEHSDPQNLYVPRICLVAGILDQEFIFDMHKKWNSDTYFVVESDPDVIAYRFQRSDLTQLISHPSYYLFLGHTKESLIAPMQRVMRQSFNASRLRLTQIVVHNLEDPKLKPECKDLYQNIISLYTKTVDHVFFNFGNMFDSLEGLRATLANKEFIAKSEGIAPLENLYKGMPFVVVGAGPSLDKDLPLLKEHQDKFVIVAVDAAAKVLDKAGIRCDYVSSIERFNVLQDKFFRDLPASKAELIAYPVVHTEVLKLFPGKIRIVYRNYAWYAYFEKNWPQGILESGGSASHLATKAAFFLGADTVFLLGCDMCYEQQGDLFRSHCQSTAYPEWEKLITIEQMDSNPDYGSSYLTEANDGSLVRTNQVYHQWAKEYASLSHSMHLGNRLGNCSLKGIKVPGVEYVNFAEVCELAKPLTLPTPPPQPTPDLSNMSNKELIENLKGYYKHAADTFHMLNSLTEENVTEEAVQVAYSLFYGKLAFETLFTAFIIQNCASEFFNAETMFNSLNETDKPILRAKALAGMYKVISNCLDYTIQLFEEAETGKVRDKVL